MRAVLLAAGAALRLRPLTETTPKCLLRVGGRSILERTLENLQRNGITELVLVTGYREEQIRRAVETGYPGMQISFIHNPSYATTNNIYSLWLTKDHVLGHDILLLDSDIVFDHRIIGLLAASGFENCLAVRSDHELGEEEIKVKLGRNGRIAAIGKTLMREESVGESIGIERFGAPFVRRLFTVLDRMIIAEEQVDVFYEAAFQETIDRGEKILPIDVGNLKCVEIDTPEDLDRATREVVPFLED
jgi:choline kinase